MASNTQRTSTSAKRTATSARTTAKKATGRSSTNNRKQSTGTSAKRTATSAQTTARNARRDAKTRVELAREQVRQAAETAVDLPVGTALTVYDRFGEIVGEYNTPTKREAELKKTRNQLRREFNKVERRGGTARRRALQSAKRTRNRVEREVKQRRRSVETTVRQNRRKAETQLKRNRADAEKAVRDLTDRVQALV